MTIDELLASYEIFAMSEFEKGERFERLMKNFLLTYPIWRGKISDVWRWKDFPFRNELGGKDLGIDLVAKTHGGEFWAAQCKFYSESTAIHKSAVDSFISNSARTFDGKKFSRRLWISTSDNFTDNAREMLKNQSPEVEIINLELLRRLQINWTLLDNGFSGEEAIIVRKLRDYQINAVNAAQIHYQNNSRGQLIMACGTGKTFTALKIAEKIFPNGKILFLVPSISLLRQTLEEWAANSTKPINAVCVCSDATASDIDDEIVDVNLPLKAMTDSEKISAELKKFSGDGLTVIFSTYQSIDVVNRLNLTFDLIVADEAHRTATFAENKTVFTKVHDENFIRADKRLYMTATPRLFKTDAKNFADESKMTDWTMSNEKIFGEEFYRISFREAVQQGYLADYKVFVLTVNENYLTPSLKKFIGDKNSSLKIDDALKLIGALLALSKHMDEKSARLIRDDKNRFMHTAVAFCSSIKDAKRIADNFSAVQEKFFADLNADKNSFVTIKADHIAGTMSANERAPKLFTLKTAAIDGNVCNVLSNVRCLSEGVDVPALDAVIFMASKKSKVEIVQAVGRVMRTANHKNFGYIIIPVVVPLNKSPEEALRNSKDFNIVWEVVNALRAHDEAMNIELERIRNKLTGKNPDDDPSVKVIVSGDPQMFLEELLRWDDLKNKIYARMVEHVGSTPYWIQWAYKVADIVERHTRRINELISVEGEPRRDFYNFLYDLQKNLNPAVTPAEAVDMLAQHLVTRPVFEALFENYSFVKNNPVSVSMQKILDKLEGEGIDKDRETFARLYNQVREMCKNMGDAAQRQRIITRLYENFFAIAFKKTSEKLGIVYTPVEVVDFILRSVDAVLKKYFNRSLSDKNVHVLDPFAGTGTFLVRLIQSGLIKPRDLLRKYLHELHANEIVLLAYYIASINIENAFYDSCKLQALSFEEDSLKAQSSKLKAFKGICFTDTFQAAEQDEDARGQIVDKTFRESFKENLQRVNDQLQTQIEVIVGNPPYSVGQKSANDNNQNQYYPKLEQRIAATYAAKTSATCKQAIYDSYIKAFRWAGDRISEGIIGFITNANWIDKDANRGMRDCFVKEFSEIYVFNLRGDIRAKEKADSKRDGENVFNIMTGVAITILVKNPEHVGDAKIFYRDIGDYLSREQKLSIINRTPNVLHETFTTLTPNDKGDWINQRGDDFDKFIPLVPDKKFSGKVQSFFVANSMGITTNRDAWIYNFSRRSLETNMRTTIDYYNTHLPTEIDPTKIVWTRATTQNKNRGHKIKFEAAQIIESFYRPFCKEMLYYSREMSNCVYKMPKLFPTGCEENLLICVTDANARKNFSALMTKRVTDLHFNDDTQCFPLYWYEAKEAKSGGMDDMFAPKKIVYEQRDGVSNFILRQAREKLVPSPSSLVPTKEDIFYYVYGFLHLPSYREKFSAELKKSLPRIILTADAKKFWQLSRAGRELAEIHLHYEHQSFADVEIIGAEKNNFAVKKLRLSKDKTTLYYNEHITIKNIPPRSFEYVVNGRSPLEWIIDRYQVKTDSASGIVNNPNDWATEHDNPRYILDLILSCITVSLKTLEIVENLPDVEFDA